MARQDSVTDLRSVQTPQLLTPMEAEDISYLPTVTSYSSGATGTALVRKIVFPSRVRLRNKYKHSGLSLRMTVLLQLFQRHLSSAHLASVRCLQPGDLQEGKR